MGKERGGRLRQGRRPDRRVIVLLFCDRKSLGSPSIACLDFVGATSGQIEKYFRHWADPEAAVQDSGTKVQGGHGNGGKCYMTQMFTDHAVFHTVRNGRGCRYGVKGGLRSSVTYQMSARVAISRWAVRVTNWIVPLRGAGALFDLLPEKAKKAFAAGSGFSIVAGVGPKHHEEKIRVVDLVAQIRDHAQMLATLHYCDAFVLHNGKLVPGCDPLEPLRIDPIPGAEEPRVVEIPTTLEDPDRWCDCFHNRPRHTFAWQTDVADL